MVVNRETQLVKAQSIRVGGILGHTLGLHVTAHTPSIQGSWTIMEGDSRKIVKSQRSEMTMVKWYLLDRTGLMCVNSRQRWLSALDQVSQCPTVE